jgi:hypothetical protein
MELNSFFASLGLKVEIIETINEKAYNLDNIYEMISDSQSWTDKSIITAIKETDIKTIKEIVTLPMEDKQVLKATDPTKSSLRQVVEKLNTKKLIPIKVNWDF